MTFQVVLHPQVVEFLKKTDAKLKERIRNKLKLLQITPFHFLEHYEGEYYKLRIGEYRALIDVDFEKKLIKVQVLDHRSRIYKSGK